MIVIELSEDKYGKAMKNIACIEDKLHAIRAMFEEDAIGHKRAYDPYKRDSHHDEDRYEDRDHYRREYSRYM